MDSKIFKILYCNLLLSRFVTPQKPIRVCDLLFKWHSPSWSHQVTKTDFYNGTMTERIVIFLAGEIGILSFRASMLFSLYLSESFLFYKVFFFFIFIFILQGSLSAEFEACRIPVPTSSRSAALLKVCAVCMTRQSQILFLSDVGIFIVHDWRVTQTRPRFNVPSERRGTTTWVVHPYPCGTMPGPGFEPGTFYVVGENSKHWATAPYTWRIC